MAATQAKIPASWKHHFEGNISLPPAWDRQQRSEDVSLPICISIKSISGIPAPKEKADVSETQYSLSVSLFDNAYNQFFGKTWSGPRVKGHYDEDKVTLSYNQNVYFHTWIKDSTMVVAVEINRHQTVKGIEESTTCGWLFLKPFANVDDLTDTTEAKSTAEQADVYHGSARALLFMDEPLDKCKHLRKIEHASLTWSVQTHQPLEKVMHLINDNQLVGGSDVIPGVQEAPKKDGIPGDCLYRPKLARKCPSYIENVVIKLPPSIEKFEEELCRSLNDDRLVRDDKRPDGTSVSVVERRLQVGVHNGFCYVEKPQVFHLTTDAVPDFRRGHKRTSSWDKRVQKDPAATGLVLKNRVELNCLVDDPLYAVVFKLEYVVAEPLSKLQRKASMVRDNHITACVRWLAWSPCSQNNQSEFTLELVGGAGFIPDSVLVYTTPRRLDADEERISPGTVKFKFVNTRKAAVGSLAPPKAQEEMMESMTFAAVAAEAAHLPVNLPPESPRRPSSRRFEERLSPSPVPFAAAREPMMTSYGSQPMMTSYGSPQMMSYPQGGIVYPQGPMGYPMPMTQAPYNEPISARTAPELQELPYLTQPHHPIIAVGSSGHSGQGLSRAAYARLYNVGFPAILDRNGDPPEVRDPDAFTNLDFQKEMYDSLQCNEITLQFLAFTRLSSLMPGSELGSDKPSSVFFTFQFYRFPPVTTERLMLSESEKELSIDNSGMPCVLRKLDQLGNANNKELPGYELKYTLDPNYLKPGEGRLFVQHLAQQTLHVDVWDGESLLLIGTCAVEMKHLLRQGQESVQVSYELDVVSTEYGDDVTPNLTGDWTRSGSVRPVGVTTALKGRLHFRMANCGFPADKTSRKDVTSYHQDTDCVIKSDQMMTFKGGSLTSCLPSARTGNSYRAQPLAETNSELASMLAPAEKDHGDKMDPIRQRKLARMQAVRTATGLENQQPMSLRLMKTDKVERSRALKTISIYRDQSKTTSIKDLLNRAISTEHTIYPSMGSTEFFEFSLKNPYNVPQTVTIVCKDEEVSAVTDVREWRYYKSLHNLTSAVEENMFTNTNEDGFPTIYVRPKEKVNIPFKFSSLQADHSVNPQGPIDPFKPNVRRNDSKSTQAARTTLIHFLTEDSKPVSILNLHIAPQPHVVNQTFRFHHPEQTFFKKAIRLPPFQHSLPGQPVNSDTMHQVFVRASDPNVICEAKAVQAGEPMDVFIKVACGNSPEIKKFFVVVYNNHFMARPAQIWQFYIHSLQRVDAACTEGQISKFTLVLRGTQASRMVKCYSSNSLEVAVQPSESFMLAANTVHELQISLCSKRVGSKFHYINVVDTEYHQLIKTWLVCLTCKPPAISKAFELELPLARSSNKRIPYTNSYQYRKKFTLHTNRDDLLQFKENELDVGPSEQATIALRFLPCMVKGEAEILIFINDEQQKTEETFCIKAKYV